jgi:group I intron endonuclease
MINNKIYVGSDKNNNPNYYGSGKILCEAISKYGKENFYKVILEKCNTLEELKQRESFWIKQLKSNVRGVGYNISDGYFGGDVFTNHPNKETYRQKLKKASEGEKNHMFGKSIYDVWREKFSENEVQEKISQHKQNQSKSIRKNLETRIVKNCYSVWVEKFGKEEADKRQKKLNEKRRHNSINKNSKSNIIEIFENEILIKQFKSMSEFCKKFEVSMRFLRALIKNNTPKKIPKDLIGKNIKIIKNSNKLKLCDVTFLPTDKKGD